MKGLLIMKNKTVRQFANDLGVHPNTVYHWIRTGMLPCLKMGGLIRIRPCDEDALYVRCEYDAQATQCVREQIAHDAPGKSKQIHKPKSRDAFELGVAA